MTDDARLSDFATANNDEEPARAARGDDGSSSAATETAPADGDTIAPADETDDATASPAIETARSTYAWGAHTCSRCGESTDRVWRGDGSLVCPECKDW
ncbi:hypothetical protein [Natrinema pallidum]|uniref:DUF7573 domain-containing protein n=1 Tax=Natrinema pallidum TaxID=69527 RepID=A0A4P9TI32_9EURY|nr:hypothetical protein [Natrinema pallidum]QCW03480.1 hypothetical protein FGF80_09585 [Natrinema pallidum]